MRRGDARRWHEATGKMMRRGDARRRHEATGKMMMIRESGGSPIKGPGRRGDRKRREESEGHGCEGSQRTSLSVATFVTIETHSDSSGLVYIVALAGATAAIIVVAFGADLGQCSLDAAIDTPVLLSA